MPVTVRRFVVFLLAMLPLIYLLQAVIRVQQGEWNLLGPEPGRAIVFFTGTWAFNLMLATLAVSPTAKHTGWRWLLLHRRMLGLFTFFYASLHLLAYSALLLEWRWMEITQEIIERPYLTLGMLAWLILLPLALTSTKGWQRRLKRRWKSLHKWSYPAAAFMAVHYLLQIRSSWFEPVLYTILVLALLGLRRWPLLQPSKEKFSG
ncbi:sulfite oxidase heme-binding subunit YedZ [Bacterioplanes sanyensis]|jgi:sulfoxide reductase heme-binding subunit YedZ|uniref:sulfite oxidase heme-binding subunit YedZ n=1 Tax=Bacterioplanes sanyensis TaxID=1249553 RepID=UPI001677F44C|nr:protein-methionine-sulfoxide reductase heme-binding subunit MsrQ [Bacterioplanes sanyensis]